MSHFSAPSFGWPYKATLFAGVLPFAVAAMLFGYLKVTTPRPPSSLDSSNGDWDPRVASPLQSYWSHYLQQSGAWWLARMLGRF